MQQFFAGSSPFTRCVWLRTLGKRFTEIKGRNIQTVTNN